MGKFKRMLMTVDSHTGGQPTRTILGGLPRIKGRTMSEKMEYFRENLDEIRRLMTYEPRGNKATSVVVLTEPCSPDADFGAFFFEHFGYMPMCGHDTIGLSTVLAETGMIPLKEPETTFRLEVPAGLIEIRIRTEEGRAKKVSFQNAPCFCYAKDWTVLRQGRNVMFDVAYGGNFYAIVPAESVGLVLRPESYRDLVKTAEELLVLINEKYEVQHPEKTYLKGVSHIEFVEPAVWEDGVLRSRNTVVVRGGGVDRSPCGTGTSARTAVLYDRGILQEGQVFCQRSITDSMFEAKVVKTAEYCGYQAVIPEITGNARLTGTAVIMLDPDDEKEGFQLEL